MRTLRTRVRRLLPADAPALSVAEQRRSVWGAFLGTLLCAALMHAMPVGDHRLIAPIGATALLAFALPQSPMAQPRSIIGGYLAASFASLASSALVPVPQLAAAVAVATSVWLMVRLSCIHPPGGALALFIVLDGPHTWLTTVSTLGLVAINVGCLLLAAVLINNLVLGRGYPYRGKPAALSVHGTRDLAPMARTGLTHADLDSAIQKLDTFVDVQESQLVQLYDLAVDHAFDRHTGLSCGDIMSRHIATVEFGTDLEQAWTQFRTHKIKALPVVDSFGRLIGIITVADYLRQMDDTTAAGLAVRLQGLLRRTPGPNSEKAEAVGQIMTADVYAARVDTPVSELVSRLSDKGLHHIPVIDDSRRVVGMVTQSDVIAALYKRMALSIA